MAPLQDNLVTGPINRLVRPYLSTSYDEFLMSHAGLTWKPYTLRKHLCSRVCTAAHRVYTQPLLKGKNRSLLCLTYLNEIFTAGSHSYFESFGQI